MVHHQGPVCEAPSVFKTSVNVCQTNGAMSQKTINFREEFLLSSVYQIFIRVSGYSIIYFICIFAFLLSVPCNRCPFLSWFYILYFLSHVFSVSSPHSSLGVVQVPPGPYSSPHGGGSMILWNVSASTRTHDSLFQKTAVFTLVVVRTSIFRGSFDTTISKIYFLTVSHLLWINYLIVCIYLYLSYILVCIILLMPLIMLHDKSFFFCSLA